MIKIDENSKKNETCGIFQKKYYRRSIVFVMLLCFFALYLFIGAVSTHWLVRRPYIITFSCLFIGINCLILCLVNYEILKLNNGDKWPVFSQIITYILVVFLYLLPIAKVGSRRCSYAPINFEFYVSLNFNWLRPWLIFVIYLIVFLIYTSLILTSKQISLWKVIITFLLSLYMVITFKAVTKFMLNNFYGWSSVLWLCLIVIFADTFSFIGGTKFGKHKLAVNISPNKTWEGLIIGVTVSAIFAILYSILIFKFTNQFSTDRNATMWVFNFFSNDDDYSTMNINIARYIVYIILSVILSFFSQFGDLLFSLIKRHYKIKDFSNILLSHGGILDRLDSFSLVFFSMYIVSNLFLL